MPRLLCVLTLLIAGAVQGAGAPVEELDPDTRQNAGSGSTNQVLVDLHDQVQALRDEVRQLRGKVEVQSNELRQLKQRQMDDYQDLDRRISALRSSEGDTGSVAETDDSGWSGADTKTGGGDSDAGGDNAASEGDDARSEEFERYTAAYDLLRQRKIDEAVEGFKSLIEDYPDGQYTANAHYWLGEIHLLQNELARAEKAFATVRERFPAHRKAPDARFKLAKVYHLQGKNQRAKELLRKVADGDSNAASLARNYLEDNF